MHTLSYGAPTGNGQGFKMLWQRHRYFRLAAGIILSGGALAASTGGAPVLAGGFIVTRAALSAVGGFLSAEALFDVLLPSGKDSEKSQEKRVGKMSKYFKLGESKKKHVLKYGISALAGAGMAAASLFGAHWAEDGSPAIVSLTRELFSRKAMSIIEADTVNASLIDRIFADILHDHPGQRSVTLEQSIRRIEGLRLGIPLEDSEELKGMDAETARSLRMPGSSIASAMRKLGFLQDGQTIDEVAPKLDRKDIASILLEAYGNHPNSTFPDHDIITDHGIDAIGKIRNPSDTMDTPRTGIIRGIAAVGAAGAIISAGLIHRALKDGKHCIQSRHNDSDTPKTGVSQKIIHRTKNAIGRAISKWKAGTSKQGDTEITEKTSSPLVDQADESTLQTAEKQTNTGGEMCAGFADRLAEISTKAEDRFGFKLWDIGDTESGSVGIMEKSTINGTFLLLYHDTPDGSSIELLWYEGDEKKGYFRSAPLAIRDGEPFSRLVSEILETGMERILIERDRRKNEEMAFDFKKVRISSEDLSMIYAQLEQPHVRLGELETGGYWFQSIYALKDGVLNLRNLCNPTREEFESTAYSFNISPVHEDSYNLRSRLGCMREEYDPYEQDLLSRIILKQHRLGRRGMLDGACMDLNWHKHPGYLHHPSQIDLNSNEGPKAKFRDSPHLRMNFWCIATTLPSYTDERNAHGNAIILRGADHGGTRDYILHFWKVRKNDMGEYDTRDLIPITAEKDTIRFG